MKQWEEDDDEEEEEEGKASKGGDKFIKMQSLMKKYKEIREKQYKTDNKEL